MTFSYDANLRLSSVTDGSGRSVLLSYRNGRVATISDPNAQRSLSYSYDAAGNLISHTDAIGNVTTYSYDGRHRLVQVSDGLGATHIDYASPNFTVGSIRRATDFRCGLKSQRFLFRCCGEDCHRYGFGQ